MEINVYQEGAAKTAIYPETVKYIYPTLGLCGEAGEVAEKVKKVFRDKGGVFSDEVKEEIIKELGDVMWYLAALASDFGIDLNDVAQRNLDKLNSRKERGVLNGNGDNR